MKLWIDDVRPAPNDDYLEIKSVNGAKEIIEFLEGLNSGFSAWDPTTCENKPVNVPILLDIDHDAGDYANDGGDYIKLLDWLEATGRNYPIRIHSMNPVGVANMRAIIKRNGWTEVM